MSDLRWSESQAAVDELGARAREARNHAAARQPAIDALGARVDALEADIESLRDAPRPASARLAALAEACAILAATNGAARRQWRRSWPDRVWARLTGRQRRR